MARPYMAAVQQEFDAGAALLKLYGSLPYVRKLGYSSGEMAGRILLRITIDADKGGDEFFDNSMNVVRKSAEFEDMMPAGMRDEYEVVPIVTRQYDGALAPFRTMTVVIDR